MRGGLNATGRRCRIKGEEGSVGRWGGPPKGLPNVSLHFSHLENRDRKRKTWRDRERQRKVGQKLMDALL